MVKAVHAKPMASKSRRSRIFKFPLKGDELGKKLNKLIEQKSDPFSEIQMIIFINLH